MGFIFNKKFNQTNLLIIIIENYFRTSSYPSNCPNDADCADVYDPGCVKDVDGISCISAQIDACTAYEEGEDVVIPTSCELSGKGNSNNQCLTSICPTRTDACYDEDASNNINVNWVIIGIAISITIYGI